MVAAAAAGRAVEGHLSMQDPQEHHNVASLLHLPLPGLPLHLPLLYIYIALIIKLNLPKHCTCYRLPRAQ